MAFRNWEARQDGQQPTFYEVEMPKFPGRSWRKG